MRPNPHVIAGDPSAINNKNRFLHDGPDPQLHGSALAIYLARAFSLLLSCGSVAAVWLAARELALLTGQNPRHLPLLAAGLVAFNPQFLFISASVSNDNLIAFLAGLVIWQVLAMMRHGPGRRRSALLTLLLALASLSKLSGLLLIMPVGLVALGFALRDGKWRELLRLALLAGVCWLVLAGPWYARNLDLYGEITGSQTMLDIFGRRPAPSLETLLTEEFRGLRYSYQGIFGAFNIFSPMIFYHVMDLVSLAGAAGLLLWFWKHRSRPAALAPVSLLAICIALFLVALVAWTLQTAASTGRLLFPVNAAGSSLLALGLLTIRMPARPAVAALGLVALLIPLVSIRPAYAFPPVVDELPEDATELNLFYENIELLGYVIPQQEYGPGDSLPVTLYWRPARRSGLNYSFFVHLLNDAGRTLVRNYGFPGGGSLQTTRWEPGVIYEDRWELPIPQIARGNTILRVQPGWWKYPEDFHLPARTDADALVDPVLLEAGSFSDRGAGAWLPLKNAIWPLDFGNSIRLLGWEQNGAEISLLWEATARPHPDLQVFLHVVDDPVPGEPDKMLAQGDSPPSTPSANWLPGERYITHHKLETLAEADPGSYRMYAGWYSTSEGWRLAADCLFNYCPVARIAFPPDVDTAP